MPWRHGGTRLVDQAVVTLSTTASAHHQQALSTTTTPRSINATSIAADTATLAAVETKYIHANNRILAG
jgi:hypothetical protein